MRNFRFAVTGAQGSGKSTLARDVFDRFLRPGEIRCELLDGIGEKVRQLGYPLGEMATDETFLAFASEHLARERTATARLIILDRCFIDLLAYAHVLGTSKAVSLRVIEECGRLSLREIDGIFLTPLVSSMESHGEADNFRRLIETKIEALAETLEVRMVRLEGTRERRADMACEFMRSIMSETPLLEDY